MILKTVEFMVLSLENAEDMVLNLHRQTDFKAIIMYQGSVIWKWPITRANGSMAKKLVTIS